MPKKTAYSRNGAQRSKPKQKSFELVRPVSDDKVLETVENNEDTEDAEVVEVKEIEPETEEEVEEKAELVKSTSARVISPVPGATAIAPTTSPKSASARMAARRQASQKTQRSSSNLITAEHYNYVRKDLLFILILAIIMFSAIIALHFILGS
jgi:hypothetical protein